MADHASPSFEDLEPEGENIEGPGSLGSAEEFEDQEFDEVLRDTQSEYEFGGNEMVEGDEFHENQRNIPPPSSLASLAARTALKWGSRATSATVFRDNGRRPIIPESVCTPAKPFEDEYLHQPEASLLDGASAVLLESYELMEELATAAVAAENKVEAVTLIAAAIPLSIHLAPTVYRALWPAIPALINGTAGVTRLLHHRPATRPLINMMPTILHKTTAQLAQHAARGRPITGQLAAKVLAKQTATVLRHQRRPRIASRRFAPSKRRSRRAHDPYTSEEWRDNGY